MQLTTLFLAGLSAVSVSAVPSMGASWEYKVPGDNPLYFCADPADYILQIEKVDLDPNPPKPYVCLHHREELNALQLPHSGSQR
jgi:hypothetical protein